MTRFARAKGSKSSNERLPEQPTAWADMKQQLLDKKTEAETSKKRKQMEDERLKNYNQFLEEKEIEEAAKVEWATFDDIKPTKKRQKTQPKEELSDNEAPEEVSCKKAVEEVAVKKAKTKKPKVQPLKIVVAAEDQDLEQQKLEKKLARRKKQKELKKLHLYGATEQEKKGPEVKSKVKNLEELPEEDRKKVERKMAKKAKQLQRQKLKKAERQTDNKTNPDNKEIVKSTKPLNGTAKKTPKKKLNKAEKPTRRKDPPSQIQIINGRQVEVEFVDGFPIKKEDAERLRILRKEMIIKGLPRHEINASLKLERRRAEKNFARERKKVCFNCRQSGHNLSECPNLEQQNNGLIDNAGSGICYKCGSTEHTHFECKVVRSNDFKFASCFICKEQGHIARQCPDNAMGLYPKGGACKVCGDVTHLKKDCPNLQADKQAQSDRMSHLVGGFQADSNPDDLLGGGAESWRGVTTSTQRPNKITRF